MYLNTLINKEIYLQQPPSYEEIDENTTLTYLLKKSIYGLKQSGRICYQSFTNFLKSGFKPGAGDQYIYTKNHNQTQIIILFWVGDILICSQDDDKITQTKNPYMDDRGELVVPGD